MTGKRIAILTFYYQNDNYGGLLQAAALVNVLRKYGFSAEQLSFDRLSSPKPFVYHEPMSAGKVFRKAQSVMRQISDKKDARLTEPYLRKRSVAMRRFAEEIPHSRVLTRETIGDIEGDYDAFVCGSDQIWNPSYTREEYFLSFVNDKPCIAYAASIGRDHLSADESAYICGHLKKFPSVSVRENLAETLLEEGGYEGDIYCVLDPVLLTGQEEWKLPVRSDGPADHYLLAYFLGDDRDARRAAETAAKARGLKLLTFPHILGKYREVDRNFGDIRNYDAGPREFLCLIRDADYVFTDSFHACAFSLLFGKKFAVTERSFDDRRMKMNSRIHSLLKTCGMDHHAMEPGSLLRGAALPEDVFFENEDFRKRREESLAYLLKMTGF